MSLMRKVQAERMGGADWRTSPAYLTALLLRLRFEVACEAYDRTLPGFMRHDEWCGDTWIPCGSEARSASVRFAENERRKLRAAEASVDGIDFATSRDAEQKANRMSYQRQLEVLAHLEESARGVR